MTASTITVDVAIFDKDAVTLCEWPTGAGRITLTVPPAAFAPDSRTLYLGGHSLDWPERGRRLADALTAGDPLTGTLRRRFADPDPAGEASQFTERFGRKVETLALSPDGRVLAVAEFPVSGESVWLYETAPGEIIKKLTGHVRQVTALVFTPDGRRLVSVSADQTGLVWDATLSALGGPGGGKPGGIGPAEAWDRLAARDAGVGYAGMAALAAAPTEAIALLRARLRPAPVPTAADLDRLFRQLDSEKYDERQKASAELETFGPNAVAGVKARLERAPSLELRKRLDRFLEGNGGSGPPSPYLLRCVRGVAVLEAIATPEARALLAELAKGPANDPLTREARAANRRRSTP
jgi:hypothetical protein